LHLLPIWWGMAAMAVTLSFNWQFAIMMMVMFA
jgi:hypothetical protein